MQKLVLIDNFDSFTYNLVQMLQALGAEVIVLRNNIALEDIIKLKPTHLVISPGPGAPPRDTGITCPAIEHFAGKIPILGVCLGHQSIGVVFGAKVVRAPAPLHGKSSRMRFSTDCPLFAGLRQLGQEAIIGVGRYHSLVVDSDSIRLTELMITAMSLDDEQIMAVQHRRHRHLYGVQFHPESILTAGLKDVMSDGSPGRRILENFLALSC